MPQENNTANVVLIILLVIVVGLVVWFFSRDSAIDTPSPTPAGDNASLEINLGGNGNQTPTP